ncbi:retrovirus-related pol polyprotein from transposon TNT 1-94 [Tanacetum coccineum]|uniref:Retrovirus-related pol polyprotein from transposon TNT 1-94 n=1 Tax=Tanacetum coccineum TaxID=301880 RepID=A0ABQ4YFQ0_9ASTR
MWLRDQHIELVNIIGDPGEGMLTRSIAARLTTASASECLFADFHSVIEPKKFGHLFLLQDEKPSLVPNGYSVTRRMYMKLLKAMRIFFAYATYINFIVYEMDVKSALLNGNLKEEVYVQQPPSFKGSEHLDYVYKLYKALYEMKEAPKACALVKTPMVPPNNLGPDLYGKPLNGTFYRGMISSLMYLTTSRHDIQFLTYLCARYQANPKESHLITVKRIFRYLKGTPTLGLWYLKCSCFDLKGYSDSDDARCNMDRKSTSCACQSLSGKLVCWSAKK